MRTEKIYQLGLDTYREYEIQTLEEAIAWSEETKTDRGSLPNFCFPKGGTSPLDGKYKE